MRDHIISEIQRLAAQAGGQPPGYRAFVSATGIIESKWRGHYWARWGDALINAGFRPNRWRGKSDEQAIFVGLITACLHYGRFPTNPELSLLRRTNLNIPSPKTLLSNFGGRSALVSAFRKYLENDAQYTDVLALLPKQTPIKEVLPKNLKAVDGHVYLIKSGEFYKIGRGDELERRVKQIRTSLPDAAKLIHSIVTDDPSGIEAYWHRRFANCRANGEWFKLSVDDVKVFIRRKFQ